MSTFVKIRLLAMIDGELEQTNKMISNELIFAKGSSREDSFMHTENIYELEQFRELLLNMREKVEAGEFDVE